MQAKDKGTLVTMTTEEKIVFKQQIKDSWGGKRWGGKCNPYEEIKEKEKLICYTGDIHW